MKEAKHEIALIQSWKHVSPEPKFVRLHKPVHGERFRFSISSGDPIQGL